MKRLANFLLVVSILAVVALLIVSAYRYVRKAAILSQAKTPAVRIAGDISDLEEYAIYTAVILSEFAVPSTELVLIASQADMGLLPTDRLIEPWSFELAQEIWDDFADKNQAPAVLGHSFSLNQPYMLVEAGDKASLNLDLWSVRIVSTPFLHFSRVGFNPQKDEALVHVGVEFLSHTIPAMTFAYGRYFLLKKVDGVWTIQGRHDTYIT